VCVCVSLSLSLSFCLCACACCMHACCFVCVNFSTGNPREYIRKCMGVYVSTRASACVYVILGVSGCVIERAHIPVADFQVAEQHSAASIRILVLYLIQHCALMYNS